jgi:uncharacterized membrane protein
VFSILNSFFGISTVSEGSRMCLSHSHTHSLTHSHTHSLTVSLTWNVLYLWRSLYILTHRRSKAIFRPFICGILNSNTVGVWMSLDIRPCSLRYCVILIIFPGIALNRYIKVTQSFETGCSTKKRKREIKIRWRKSRRASICIMQECQLSWRTAYLDIKIQKELFLVPHYVVQIREMWQCVLHVPAAAISSECIVTALHICASRFMIVLLNSIY